MHPSGLAEVEAARADGRRDAGHAPASAAQLPPDLRAALGASPQAAAFSATPKGANRYAILYRVDTAKRPETRAKRIAEFIAMLPRGEAVPPVEGRGLMIRISSKKSEPLFIFWINGLQGWADVGRSAR